MGICEKENQRQINLGTILRPNSNLNIFLCGKYRVDKKILEYFNFRQKIDFEEEDFELKYNIYIQDSNNMISKWEFYEINPIGINDCKKIKNFLEDKINKNQIQNVIIYFNESIEDNDLELINQLSNIKKSSQPFIIFINKKYKNTKDYNEYIIKNEIKKGKFFFDILNIYIIDFKQFDSLINGKYNKNEGLIEILWNIYTYYYQIDYNINIYDAISQNDCCLNIYITGKPGTGKSTFINELFQEKKALENIGKNQTQKIRKYSYTLKNFLSHKKQTINLFDCPGYSTSGDELNELKTIVSNVFTNYVSHKDLIHCFLYFFDGRSKRTLDGKEIEFINFVHETQTQIFGHSKIYFIINFVNKSEESDKNSYKNTLYDQLTEQFHNSDIINKENIIEINLKRELNENRKIKFGIDDILFKMYSYFEKHKINIDEIQNIQRNNKLNDKEKLNMQIQKIKQSLFFKFFERNDFLERNILICNNIIESAKRETERIGYFLFNSDINNCENIRRQMFEDLNEHFITNFKVDIKFISNDYKIHDDEFLDESKLSKFIIIKYFYHAKKMKENCPLITERKGKEYLKKNMNLLGEKERSNVEHLLTLADLYNCSVDLLLNIYNKQKQYYLFENENFKNIKTVIKVEEQSLLEYEKIMKKKTPKFEVKNNQLLVILNIENEHPSINVKEVILIGQYYIFEIIINEIEIIKFSKSIEEIQLVDNSVNEIVQGEKNEYICKFDLINNSKSSKKVQF